MLGYLETGQDHLYVHAHWKSGKGPASRGQSWGVQRWVAEYHKLGDIGEVVGVAMRGDGGELLELASGAVLTIHPITFDSAVWLADLPELLNPLGAEARRP